MGSNIYFSASSSKQPLTFSYLTSGGRPLNSTYQISTTRDVFVSYSLDLPSTITLTTGTTSTAFLEISSDGSIWSSVAEVSNGISGTVAVGTTINCSAVGVLAGIIKTGMFVRIRTTGTTPTFLLGQEVYL